LIDLLFLINFWFKNNLFYAVMLSVNLLAEGFKVNLKGLPGKHISRFGMGIEKSNSSVSISEFYDQLSKEAAALSRKIHAA
jgi:hypothetical protein